MTDVHLTDPSWVRQVSARHRQQDAVLAGVLMALGAASLSLSASDPALRQPPVWLSVACMLLVTAPLVWRRSAPDAVVVAVVTALIVGQVLLVPEQIVSQLCALVALYTVAAWSPHRRRTAIVLGVLVTVTAVWLVVSLTLGGPGAAPGSDGPASAQTVLLSVLGTLLSYGVVLALGKSSWNSERRLEALRDRTAELLVERERSAAQAVVVERLRIARELHDVVAHHVSVMGVQAGAARRMLPGDVQRAAQSLSDIEDSARTAVGELHQLLTTLRNDEGAELQGPSTLRLSALPDLVQLTTSAGTPAHLSIHGTPATVSHMVQVALYRVAQEALTNVRKHAGAGAEVQVVLRWQTDQVVLEVRDRSPRGSAVGRTQEKRGRMGLGLVGMRERISAVGGTVHTGLTDDGYAVLVVVPSTASNGDGA